MKQASSNHKRSMSDLDKNIKYSIKYTTSPSKSYVVEPKNGKINYSKQKNDQFVEELK